LFMHKKLVSFVKYNKLFLFLYRLFGNCMLFILRLFVRVKDKRVLFMSFGGQKFDDSPRA
ncbi:MAG: CDP-glycerol--poly(glycerophosphate) glycerophosphotransferase, partial [Clostridia bacterium]|nr:CDP-glycerol--poly(glycerophosphate) glycerophosphotransferase [Clostridia bacterium]